MAKQKKAPPRTLAFYGGKVVDMATKVPDPKMWYQLAWYRVSDNVGKGYVIVGDHVYAVAPGVNGRTAKPLPAEQAAPVLAEALALLTPAQA